MICIQNLSVSINGNLVIKDISLSVGSGTVHALMGPNGSGKSTLVHTIAGNPLCVINTGTISAHTNNITMAAPEVRARLGIFLSFQQPPSIAGVPILTLLHESYQAIFGITIEYAAFLDRVHDAARVIGFDVALFDRSFNVGFSGGQKKQLELLQIVLFKPSLIMLDEIDSGLDIDALRAVAIAIQYARSYNPSASVIIITHYQRILDYIIPDVVHIMNHGSIVKSGTIELVKELELKGYESYRADSNE